MPQFSEESPAAERFDVIVVGLGGHGSAAVAQIAQSLRSGQRVLGIEQFERTHGHGSSHGRSRIYRQAYFEHPSYVPLLQRSLELWKYLDAFHANNEATMPPSDFCGPLLSLCGGIMIGRRGTEVVEGTLKSIATHALPHEVLSAEQIRTRFPVFQPEDDEIGVFEENAGYLHPELCIETYVEIARSAGATLRYGEKLVSFSAEEDGAVRVQTDKGAYSCGKLVLTVGVWAPQIFGADIPLPLHCERRVLYWFKPQLQAEQQHYYKDMPIYIWDLGESGGSFYGFPEQRGFEGTAKVAMHFGQDATLFRRCEPHSVDRDVAEYELDAMRAMLRDRMPTLNGDLDSTATCMYTMTPDQHFLIDFHPTQKNVILASPCSGHGFKFCSVVGEILRDLALTGETPHDIAFLGLHKRIIV